MQTYEESMRKVPRLADQRASSFLSSTVGNKMKQNVDYVNCNKMIDRAV